MKRMSQTRNERLLLPKYKKSLDNRQISDGKVYAPDLNRQECLNQPTGHFQL